MSGPRISVVGTGLYVPDRLVTNEDLAKVLDTSDEWIRTRTGIKQRYFAEPGTGAAPLGAEAGRRALAAAKVAPEDIDLVLCATMTPDYIIPSCAALIQRDLKLENAGGFDLMAACSGWVFGTVTAAQFLAAGTARHVLLVGAEQMTSVIDPEDRGTRVIFGDGAAAAVIRASRDDEPGQLLHSKMRLAGNDELLYIPAGGSRQPSIDAASIERRDHYVKMKGREIFRFAVTRFGELIEDALQGAGVTVDDIKLVIPHQVNLRIIESAVDRVGLSMDRVLLNIDRYGNTSGASVGIALHEAADSGRIERGDLVLMVAFGAGLSWGSALLRW